MRYFLIGLAVLVIVLLLCIFFCFLRKKWARKKVCGLDCKTKCRRLDEALLAFGFCYDRCNDAIASCMYPWQREMGYCRAYDEAAPSMNMVFDSEPVYFDYEGRHYLLEFWKGQYGCTTGAEIGFYVCDETEAFGKQDPSAYFYECVRDEERLSMQFFLYKGEQVILKRQGVHWWLTGFVPGMFSESCELRMNIALTFPNRKMCMAFCEGLLRTGYGPENICVEQTRVIFTFDRPWSKQPGFYGARYLRRINRRNQRNCRRYCRITKCFCTTLDKICYIGYCFPLLFRFVRKLGTKCSYCKLKRFRKRAEKKPCR